MKSLTPLAKMILETLEPDPTKQQQWLDRPDLYAPSQDPEMESFKEMMEDMKRNGDKVFVAGDYDCGATRFWTDKNPDTIIY
ncbi:hypothetical protein C815_01130 [Firmicutes bacterium M10-2]|nr:hypothetical protein C815_01130 [Firmicutes bacterium M10-2]